MTRTVFGRSNQRNNLQFALFLTSFLRVVKLSNSDEYLRLIDDGFGKICNMVNDVSVRVRTEAASLLVGGIPYLL